MFARVVFSLLDTAFELRTQLGGGNMARYYKYYRSKGCANAQCWGCAWNTWQKPCYCEGSVQKSPILLDFEALFSEPPGEHWIWSGLRVRRDNMKPERHIKTPFGEAWEYNAQRNRRRTPACNPSNFVFCYSFSVQCFHLLLYPVHIVLPGCLRHMRRERSWCHNGFFSGLNWLFALRTYLYDSISHMFSVIFSPVHSQQVGNATWWFHAKYVGMALVLPWKSMCWIVESRVSATQCSPRPTRILDDFVSWLLGSQFKTCFFGMGHADTSEEIFCLDDWQIVSSPAASIQWDISRCTNDSSLDCPLVCTVVCTGCSDFLFPIMCIGGIIRGVCCQMLGCGERYPCILGGFLSST